MHLKGWFGTVRQASSFPTIAFRSNRDVGNYGICWTLFMPKSYDWTGFCWSSMSFDLKLFNRFYYHLFCSAWEFPFGMLRHRGSLDNSHEDIYSFTASCANPRLFLHWSSSPTAHIRLCDQAEVHCDRGVSREIRQIKVHPGVGWRNLSGEGPIPR